MVTMVGRSDLVAGTALPARAQQQTHVVAYQRALAQVCQTKVTPEVIRLYQAWRVLNMHPFGDWTARAGAALAVFCAAAGGMRLLLDGRPPLVQVVVGAIVAAAAYGLALRATGVITGSDRPLRSLARGAGRAGLTARTASPTPSAPTP
jgi:hypothetical protein